MSYRCSCHIDHISLQAWMSFLWILINRVAYQVKQAYHHCFRLTLLSDGGRNAFISM